MPGGGGSEPSGHPSASSETPPHCQLNSSLPDILHSHIHPHIPPARPNQHRHNRGGARRPEDEAASRGNRQRQRNNHRDRPGRTSRSQSSRTHSTSSSQTQEGSCKEPCVKCVYTVTSFRWVLVVLSILGVACIVTGIVLAALSSPGTLLFLAIMFISLGVLLVVVVAVGWKCTPRGHEPLHALFGIGNFRHHRRRRGRTGRHRSRDTNWFGGMLYPEFQYRRPPPSYAASMQDYQNQSPPSPAQPESPVPENLAQSNGGSLPGSPPPSYRSRASTVHSGVINAFPHSQDGDYPNSRPPTYRSRAPSRRPSIPLEEELYHSVSDYETGNAAEQEAASVDYSDIPHSSAEADRAVSTSTPLTFSHLPSSGPLSAADMWSMDSSSKQLASSSEISQIYTVPLRSSNEIGNQNLTTAHDTPNFTSDFSAPPPHHQQNQTAGGGGGTRPPSLHQRMASEDCHILEQTLQSLEQQLNESVGITNPGASLDDQDQVTGHINTYL